MYYGTPASHEIKGVWCHPCFGEIKTETVPLDGFNIRKAELEKRKNDDEVRSFSLVYLQKLSIVQAKPWLLLALCKDGCRISKRAMAVPRVFGGLFRRASTVLNSPVC